MVDVIIIGGGWTGLVACKHFLHAGLSCILLEKRGAVGGVWQYSDDPSIVSVMKNTVTTSSKTITEIADFPMPDDSGLFPSHKIVYQYLLDYAKTFDLFPHIECNKEVVSAKKESGQWTVTCKDQTTYTSSYLAVCSGTHQIPNDEVRKTLFQPFQGSIEHSICYKEPKKEHFGKNILVYGGGETASDISSELSEVAKHLYCSIPHGQWFLRKVDQFGDAFDHFSSKLRKWACPTSSGCHTMAHLYQSNFGFCGHGIEEWRSPSPYFGQFFNKSPAILEKVAEKKVTALPGIQEVKANSIVFENQKEVPIDHIILCTGYHSDPYFLDEQYKKPLQDRFKFIFDPDEKTLAFLGFVRPTVTSIPIIAEIQARLVSRVFSKKISLPSKEQMEQTIKHDMAYLQEKFKTTSMHIKNLVDPQWYSDSVAKLGEFKPNYTTLFFENPYFWYLCITSPAHGAQYLINDKKYRKYITDLYKKLRPKPKMFRFYVDSLFGWVFVYFIERVLLLKKRLGEKFKRAS